jgi:hypothetical protein
MTKETLSSVKFTELEIPEDDLSYLDETDKLDFLLDLLKKNNLYNQDALYCGIEGKTIKKTGTFGIRDKTWGVTEEQFREETRQHDTFDKRDRNPIAYALLSEDLPAIVVLDKTYFDHLDDGLQDDMQWNLHRGTFDQAVVAVIYLTH